MSLAVYKKKLVDLREKLNKAKEQKKKDNAHYASLIKNTSSSSSKASYRKSKIDRATSNDRTIEGIKREIENTKALIARSKK